MLPRPISDGYGGRRHHALGDDVRLSDRANIFTFTRPIEIPASRTGGEQNKLLEAARSVNHFLDETPRITSSPFGRAAGLLVRSAVHFANREDDGNLAPDGEKTVMQGVSAAKDFLEKHPRVADSPFGRAVAKLGAEIVSHIGADNHNAGATSIDRVVRAATATQAFLETHRNIAGLPLGQIVEKLVAGVNELGDESAIDADIQQLAKRISKFVANHPRLAQSEFGQLVAGLTRGILALDTIVPPEVDPPVVADFRPQTGPAVADSRPIDQVNRITGVGKAKAA